MKKNSMKNFIKIKKYLWKKNLQIQILTDKIS